ncbi:MAG: SirB2 family protein [Gammaproteobacteria bacterium]|nr:SirB2 family protein [Gammaproteobacteria bacterium]
MNTYLLIKTIHISTVIISITLFLSRAYWLISRSPLINNKVIKYLPHLNDTILLSSAIILLFLGNLYPGKENPWLIAKFIAMLCYIFTGLYLFRMAKSIKSIVLTTLFAVLIYLYIVHTAIVKNISPLFF